MHHHEQAMGSIHGEAIVSFGCDHPQLQLWPCNLVRIKAPKAHLRGAILQILADIYDLNQTVSVITRVMRPSTAGLTVTSVSGG
jgi:hypothetical protein